MITLYSMVDQDGMIVRSQYTSNPDAAVFDGHRLLPDVPITTSDPTMMVKRVEPIPDSAASVPYVTVLIPKDDLAVTYRALRDALLAESDFTQLPDCPLSAEQKVAWASYRQCLRDLPSSPDFPYGTQFPLRP